LDVVVEGRGVLWRELDNKKCWKEKVVWWFCGPQL